MTNLVYFKDVYKTGHPNQYPPGTSLIFSNFTPRYSLNGFEAVTFYGTKFLISQINRYLKKKQVKVDKYETLITNILGQRYYADHIQELKEYVQLYQKLPVAIHALDELSIVPINVPTLVIYNTHPRFFWVPGMLEDFISAHLWPLSTAATTANQYFHLFKHYAHFTDPSNIDFVEYQGHDFSLRGLMGHSAAIMCGLPHLQFFKGSDNIPAIRTYRALYTQHRGESVPATEHSVMCAHGKENEFAFYNELITEIYPTGCISIVSDTWDLWNVVTNYLPKLKDKIMNREGKVIIRPDSGDPVKIICGDLKAHQECERKGLIECLWDIFGGTENERGYKVLDPHIGAIYGDGINYVRANDILKGLMKKHFASTNIVFGIGSYSYQYVTRDTYGWAMKATYAEIDGEPRILHKDPKTGDGKKRSHKGLLKVTTHASGSLICQENCTWEEFKADDNLLKRIY